MTRAQEAEENYVIKRELAVVRQQCSSAAEDLQKAQSTIRQLQEQQVPDRVGGAAVGRPRLRLPPSALSSCLWSSRGTGWGRALQFLTGHGGGGHPEPKADSPPAPQHLLAPDSGRRWGSGEEPCGFHVSTTLWGAWPAIESMIVDLLLYL